LNHPSHHHIANIAHQISVQNNIQSKNVRKLFLPAWDLLNGTKNASKSGLDGASESCEWWAVGCGASDANERATGLMLPELGDNWLEEMNERVRDAFISAEIDFVNGWPLEAVGPKHPPML
jgi:hypothetical protein